MRFVGQANKIDNEGMDQKKQTETLEQFRGGDFTVLVSSSIGEEGLHVPDVDLVVFYEAVPSETHPFRGDSGGVRMDYSRTADFAILLSDFARRRTVLRFFGLP